MLNNLEEHPIAASWKSRRICWRCKNISWSTIRKNTFDGFEAFISANAHPKPLHSFSWLEKLLRIQSSLLLLYLVVRSLSIPSRTIYWRNDGGLLLYFLKTFSLNTCSSEHLNRPHILLFLSFSLLLESIRFSYCIRPSIILTSYLIFQLCCLPFTQQARRHSHILRLIQNHGLTQRFLLRLHTLIYSSSLRQSRISVSEWWGLG